MADATVRVLSRCAAGNHVVVEIDTGAGITTRMLTLEEHTKARQSVDEIADVVIHNLRTSFVRDGRSKESTDEELTTTLGRGFKA